VNVEDRAAERVDRRERISAHPEQMARIEIGPDYGPDFLSELQEQWHIVDELVAVQFDGKLLDAIRPGKIDQLAAIGEEHLIPLPF